MIFGDRRIHATNQHHRQKSKLNLAKRVTEGVSRGRAAGGDDVAHAAQAESHTDLAGERAHRPTGDAEQADLLYLPSQPQPNLLSESTLCASARAKHHTDLTLLLQRQLRGLDARIAQCLG